MRVLVTGHKGYIGSVMVPMLIRAGHAVVGVDTCYYADGPSSPGDEDLAVMRRDIRDLLPEHLQGCNAVVHLAGLSYDRLGELDRDLTYEINYQATVRLARVAKEAGVERFLFASSCSVYGTSEAGVVAETAPLKPLSPYAESKAMAEDGLRGLADSGFSPVSLRNASCYGASPRFRADLVLNNLVGWAVLTGAVRLMSDGSAWRPIAHVEDVSRAFLAVLTAPRDTIRDQVFNVGVNAENYRVRDIASIAVDAVPGSALEFAGTGDADPRNYRADFSKLPAAVPSYRPIWNARSGAEELCRFYGQSGMTAHEMQGPRFVRVKRLAQLRDSREIDSSLRWTEPTTSAAGADGG